MTSRFKRRITWWAAAACFITLTAFPIAAAETSEEENPVSAAAMIVDAAGLRPLGLAATAAGGAAFIVTLPFSIPGDNLEECAQELVVDPFRFTFLRPLGRVD